MGPTRSLGYRVQVFASFDKNKSLNVKNQLQEAGYQKVFIVRDGKWYKVQIGDYSSREKAGEVASKLNGEGWETWVVSGPFTPRSGNWIEIFYKKEVIFRGKVLELGGEVKIENYGLFPGKTEIVMSGHSLTVYNLVPLRDLLYGLVAGELSIKDRKHLEAAKAQAVASRSFILHELFYGNEEVFTFNNYRGLEGVNYLAKMAVNLTSGEVLVYDGRIIKAVYHEDSGGLTADSKDVLAEEIPYLKPVTDGLKKQKSGIRFFSGHELEKKTYRVVKG